MSEFENKPDMMETAADAAEAAAETAAEAAAETAAEAVAETAAEAAAEVAAETAVEAPSLDDVTGQAVNFVLNTDNYASEYLKETMPEAVPEPAPQPQAVPQPAPQPAQAFQPQPQPIPQPQQFTQPKPAPQPAPQPCSTMNDYQQMNAQRAAQMNQQFQQYQQQSAQRAAQMNPQAAGGNTYSQAGTYTAPQPGPAAQNPGPGVAGGFATGYTGGADQNWENNGTFARYQAGGPGNEPQGGSPYGQPTGQGYQAAGAQGYQPNQQSYQAGPQNYQAGPQGFQTGNPGYQNYSQPAPASEDPGYTMSIISMICGIVSCVLFWGRIGGFLSILCGAAAIVLGVMSGKKSLTGERNGMATAGLITGIIGISLSIISIACWTCVCASLSSEFMSEFF